MYSLANVSVLCPPTRVLPSVIVDTEKVLREAEVRLENWTMRAGEEPEERKRSTLEYRWVKRFVRILDRFDSI